jgi:hypothetical protein
MGIKWVAAIVIVTFAIVAGLTAVSVMALRYVFSTGDSLVVKSVQNIAPVNLISYVDEQEGFRSLVPEGWHSTEPGTLEWKRSSHDVTGVSVKALDGLSGQALSSIVAAIGQPIVEHEETHQSSTLTWTLYRSRVNLPQFKSTVVTALAESQGKVYMVKLQATPEEYEALSKAVLIPILDAFTPF